MTNCNHDTDDNDGFLRLRARDHGHEHDLGGSHDDYDAYEGQLERFGIHRDLPDAPAAPLWLIAVAAAIAVLISALLIWREMR